MLPICSNLHKFKISTRVRRVIQNEYLIEFFPFERARDANDNDNSISRDWNLHVLQDGATYHLIVFHLLQMLNGWLQHKPKRFPIPYSRMSIGIQSKVLLNKTWNL